MFRAWMLLPGTIVLSMIAAASVMPGALHPERASANLPGGHGTPTVEVTGTREAGPTAGATRASGTRTVVASVTFAPTHTAVPTATDAPISITEIGRAHV